MRTGKARRRREREVDAAVAGLGAGAQAFSWAHVDQLKAASRPLPPRRRPSANQQPGGAWAKSPLWSQSSTLVQYRYQVRDCTWRVGDAALRERVLLSKLSREIC